MKAEISVLWEQAQGMMQGFMAILPNIVIALIVFIIFVYIGTFLAAGTIATTLAGAGIGAAAGGVIGALTGLGIPEEEARDYSERVSQGEYLVIIEGTEAEIRQAATVLSHQGIQRWRVHTISDNRSYSDVPHRTTTVI